MVLKTQNNAAAGHGQGATIAHLLALNPTTSGNHKIWQETNHFQKSQYSHIVIFFSHFHISGSVIVFFCPPVLFSKMILASGSALCEGSLNSPTLSYSSSSNANSSPYVSSSSTASTRWESQIINDISCSTSHPSSSPHSLKTGRFKSLMVWLNCYCWGNSSILEGQFSKWF